MFLGFLGLKELLDKMFHADCFQIVFWGPKELSKELILWSFPGKTFINEVQINQTVFFPWLSHIFFFLRTKEWEGAEIRN